MASAAPWYWKKVNLFDGADDAARQTFFQHAEKFEYRKNDHIFRADDEGKRVFFLEEGIVKIYHLSPEGEPAIFWFCVPGDLFGAGGISGSLHQSVYGQAVEPSIVYAIPRSSFERVLKAHPQLAINVIRLMGARLRLACDSMTDLVSRKTDIRLARLLLRLAYNWGQPSPRGVELRVAITHQEMANMIGACRQTVNETLHDFCGQRLIVMNGRRITILSPEHLQELVDRGFAPAIKTRAEFFPKAMNKIR